MSKAAAKIHKILEESKLKHQNLKFKMYFYSLVSCNNREYGCSYSKLKQID